MSIILSSSKSMLASSSRKYLLPLKSILNNQDMHKYMISSPATVFLIVRKCWQHITLVDINLESWGIHSM